MSQVSRATIKSYLEAGDLPNQSQFADFVDSVKWHDDPVSVTVLHFGNDVTGTTVTLPVPNRAQEDIILVVVNGFPVVPDDIKTNPAAQAWTIAGNGVNSVITFANALSSDYVHIIYK